MCILVSYLEIYFWIIEAGLNLSFLHVKCFWRCTSEKSKREIAKNNHLHDLAIYPFFFQKPFHYQSRFSLQDFILVFHHIKRAKEVVIQGKVNLFQAPLFILILFRSSKKLRWIRKRISEFYMNSFRNVFLDVVCFYLPAVYF